MRRRRRCASAGELPPVWPRIVPAGVGAAALTLLWIIVLANLRQIFVVFGLDGVECTVLVGCYAPPLLWGPLLGAVTVS